MNISVRTYTANIFVRCLLAAGITLLMTPAFRATLAQARYQTRCGWFSNPTPANAWLNDKYGKWIIGIQGGYQAEGDWPHFTDKQWVETNVHYGYGCACIRGKFDMRSKRVIEVRSGYARALSACRKDRTLPKP